MLEYIPALFPRTAKIPRFQGFSAVSAARKPLTFGALQPEVHTLSVASKNVRELTSAQKQDIVSRLNTQGFVILDFNSVPGINAEDLRQALRDLSVYFGPAMRHEYSEADGVSVIATKESLNKTKDRRPDFLHQDGLYEKKRPRMIALACVKQARKGAESMLVRFKDAFDRLVIQAPEQVEMLFHEPTFLSSNGHLIALKPETEGQLPVYKFCTRGACRLEGGRVIGSFRYEDVVDGIRDAQHGDISPVERKPTSVTVSHDPEKMAAFDALKNILAELAPETMFRMKENQIVIFNNMDMLHGSNKYLEGERLIYRCWYTGEGGEFSRDLKYGFETDFTVQHPSLDARLAAMKSRLLEKYQRKTAPGPLRAGDVLPNALAPDDSASSDSGTSEKSS